MTRESFDAAMTVLIITAFPDGFGDAWYFSFCAWTDDGVWVLVSGLGDVLFRISDLTLRYGSPACSYTLLLPIE